LSLNPALLQGQGKDIPIGGKKREEKIKKERSTYKTWSRLPLEKTPAGNSAILL